MCDSETSVCSEKVGRPAVTRVQGASLGIVGAPSANTELFRSTLTRRNFCGRCRSHRNKYLAFQTFIVQLSKHGHKRRRSDNS